MLPVLQSSPSVSQSGHFLSQYQTRVELIVKFAKFAVTERPRDDIKQGSGANSATPPCASTLVLSFEHYHTLKNYRIMS